MTEIAITLSPTDVERIELVLDAMRARMPDIRDGIFLSFLLQLGVLEAMRLYRVTPPPGAEPSGIFAELMEDAHE